MINSNDQNQLTQFLKETKYKKEEDFLNFTEYRELYNAERLYEKSARYSNI